MRSAHARVNIQSFNPCFLRPFCNVKKRVWESRANPQCFNPYFPGLFCNGGIRIEFGKPSYIVSILVFLDSPATLGLAHRTFSVCCFNPCFPGLSCNGDKTVIIPFENVFQSLFSWTLLQLGYKNRVGQTLLYRFNPCFPGLSCNSISMTSAVR